MNTDWPDPDKVRRALDGNDWAQRPSTHSVEAIGAAARAYLRLREEPCFLVECKEPAHYLIAACHKHGDGVLGTPAEPALTIEQVIAACGGEKQWEFTVYPLREGFAARVRVNGGEYMYSPDGCATPDEAVQALGREAIAKIKERHAADAAKLKELGVES